LDTQVKETLNPAKSFSRD